MLITRRRRTPLLLATTLSVTLGLVAAAPAASAASVTVDDLTPPLAPVSLARLEAAQVTLTFQVESTAGQTRSPRVVDQTAAVPFRSVKATLVTGDLTTGTWEASVTLASVMDGTHRPRVRVCATDAPCAPLPLTTDIVVDGSDQPTVGSIDQSPERLPAGTVAGAEARGRVTFADTGAPVRGMTVRLTRKAGDTGRVVDRTGARGRFTSPWPWTFAGQDPARVLLTHPDFPDVQWDTVVLGYPRTTFRVPEPRSPGVLPPGKSLTLKGTVTPGYPADRLGEIRLQERTNRGWVTRDRARLRQLKGASGRPVNRAGYRLHAGFDKSGKHVLRLVKPAALCAGAGPCRVAAARSPRFTVVVGDRTYLVEHRLAALGVPVGEVDGVVDARSRQAFCAWRDMTGQKPSRDGVTRRLVASVMSHNELPAPERPAGLYVNKTCQVLLQVKGGEFRRVVWVSTGKPGFDTPNATGRIFRKVEGWVESSLYPGAFMLSPMFFLPSRPGIAIHGSASNDLVLPYPASHGCVRTWRPQISRLFEESPLGTRVKVYGHY